MDHQDIIRIVLLSDHRIVNEFLDAGWTLVNTYTECYDTVGPAVKHQTMYYVVGWKFVPFDPERKEPKYPKGYNENGERIRNYDESL